MAFAIPVKAAVVGTLEVSSPQFYGNAVLQVKLYDPDLIGQDNVRITWDYGQGKTPVNLTSPLKNGEFFGYFMNNSNVHNMSLPVSPVSELWKNNNGGNVSCPPYGAFNLPVYNATIPSGTTITFEYMDSSPVGTVTASVKYDQYVASAADITFDRTTLEYPMNGWMRISIKDYDYNTDPTVADTAINLSIKFYYPNGTLIGNVIKNATETGPATGIFKVDIAYTTDPSRFIGDINITDITSGTPIKVGYANETAEPYKWVTLKSFPISLIVPDTFTTRGDLTITLRDPNLNLKTWEAEYINGTIINTYINVSMGKDWELLNLKETGKDTGEFSATLPVVIDNASGKQNDGVLQVEVGQTKATITYYFNSTTVKKAETVSTLSTTPVEITTDKTMYKKDATVKITITAPDLNDDINNPNFFTITLPNDNSTIENRMVNDNGQRVGNFTIKVNGLLARTDSGATLTFVETGPDTNVFTASLSLSKIYRNDNTTLANGDTVDLIYYDCINKVTKTASFTIGVAAASISLDRTSYPVPKDGSVVIRITVNDTEANKDPSTIDSASGYLDVYYYNGTLVSSNNVSLTETGPNTGVFTGTYTLAQSLDPAFINGWVKALYVDPASGKNITATATLVATDASISTDKTEVKAGDTLTITVVDPDWNFDTKTKDFGVIVKYEYTDNTGASQSGTWSLTETDVNTATFTKTITIGSDIKVKPGTTIKFTYNDYTPSYITAASGYPTTPVTRTATVKVASFTGTLSIDKTEYGLGSKMIITVNDPDLNTDITSKQSVTVTLRLGNGTDIPVPLVEDGANSAIFKTTWTWPVDTNLIGMKFMIYYKDEADAEGNTVFASVTGTIKSWNAEVSFEKTYYNIGDIVTVIVKDPDANKYPDKIETVTVTVTSDTDPIGQSITATETDVNTGVFVGRIQIVGAYESGKVYVKYGDTLYAKYIDPYPADYATTGKSKTFTGTAIVGVPVARPVPASAQKFVDPVTGTELTAGTVGKAIGLQATVKNVDVVSKPFTAVFKVKDAAGVTIYIAWISGTLAPGQELTPGVSWTPDKSGNYTVEVMVFKSLSEPTPFSDVISTTLTVR
jgi:plastocyanin